MEPSVQKRMSNGICLGAVLVILALLCFHGELYLSENGYLLLRQSFSFDSSMEDWFPYESCYDTVVNGNQIYISLWREPKFPLPPFSYQFTISPQHCIEEIVITKEYGKISYELLEPLEYIEQYAEVYYGGMDGIYKELDIVMEFLGQYWTDDSLQWANREGIDGERSAKAAAAVLTMALLQAAALLASSMAGKKGKELFRPVCYGVCSLLQISIVVLHVFNYITVM